MTIKEEKKLRSEIESMVMESIFDFFNTNEDDGDNSSSEDNVSKPSDDKKGGLTKEKETRIINALKSKGINKAQYAYKLWPEKDKDSARSYFYKCLDKKKNDEGDTYSFDNAEFVKLNSELSNEQL